METDFYTAFDENIIHQVAVSMYFMPFKRVRLRNGYDFFLGGYVTSFSNGYSLVVNGTNVGSIPSIDNTILDPESIPIARDTEDIWDPEEMGQTEMRKYVSEITFANSFEQFIAGEKSCVMGV